MRRRYIAAIIGSGCGAILLAACGSGSSNNATSTPASGAASATPRASATLATTPTAAATAAPSPTAATPTQGPAGQPTSPPPTQAPVVQPTKAPPPPPPPPTQAPASQSRTIVAQNITFDPRQITASAGVPLTITLDNKDAGVAHDIVIYAQGSGSPIAQTDVITGPSTTSVTVTLAPGTYPFKCSVHPQRMYGAIQVQ